MRVALGKRVDQIETDVGAIQGTLADLLEGQRALQDHMNTRFAEMQADIKDLKSDVKRIDEKIDRVADRLDEKIDSLSEKLDTIIGLVMP